MTAYDIPQLQQKVAELQQENTLLKRTLASIEYKHDELIHRIAGLCDQIARLGVKVGLHLEDHDQKQQAYNFMKSLAELGDAPEEDEAWAHLQAGD